MQNQTSTIGREAEKCSKAFRHALERPSTIFTHEEKVHRHRKSIIQNNFERFKIWLKSAAIDQPREPLMEDRLKGKTYITDYILNCLRDLKTCLDKGKPTGAFLTRPISRKGYITHCNGFGNSLWMKLPSHEAQIEHRADATACCKNRLEILNATSIRSANFSASSPLR